MKVGIDVSTAVYGTGVSDYTLNLVSNLPHARLFGVSLRRQHELQNLFPLARILPFPPTAWEMLGNRLRVVPIETFVGPMDVYHSSDWVQFPSHAKKVTTVHDLSPFLYPQEIDPSIVAVHTRRMKLAVAECDKFICVSHNTASDLQRLFAVPESKMTVIYEALPARFQLTPRITRRANYVVTIGARQPRKNIARLISAYLTYKDKLNLPPKLVIVGENTQISTDPTVVYSGYLSDQNLVDTLAGAAAFVYPSLYEGFGLPILGAFYHRVPVAAANTSSIPEVAGGAAVLFDPVNEHAIATAIARAIKDREQLVAQGMQQLAKFSWKTTAQQTMQVYESLIC